MTAGDRRVAIGLSLLMTVSVAVNLVAFQARRDQRVDASSGARTSWVDGPNAAQLAGGDAVKPMTGPGPYGKADAGSVDPAETTRGIQRELNARDYEAGTPDGVAGAVTRGAIMAYEFDHGLALSGRPSEVLLNQIVLGSSSTDALSARGTRTTTPDGEAFIRNVKQQMATLGYQVGAAGGTLTPEFTRAIRKFEADQKLKDTGRISAPLVSRLIRLQGDVKTKRAAAGHSSAH